MPIVFFLFTLGSALIVVADSIQAFLLLRLLQTMGGCAGLFAHIACAMLLFCLASAGVDFFHDNTIFPMVETIPASSPWIPWSFPWIALSSKTARQPTQRTTSKRASRRHRGKKTAKSIQFFQISPC